MKVLILDEPTSVLGVRQTADLLAMIDKVRRQGIAILFSCQSSIRVTSLRFSRAKTGRQSGSTRSCGGQSAGKDVARARHRHRDLQVPANREFGLLRTQRIRRRRGFADLEAFRNSANRKALFMRQPQYRSNVFPCSSSCLLPASVANRAPRRPTNSRPLNIKGFTKNCIRPMIRQRAD